MHKHVWDEHARYQDLKEWIAANHERVTVSGRDELARVASKQSGVLIGSSDFRLQSLMFAARALVGLMEGNEDALDLLYQAAYAARYNVSLQAANHYANPPAAAAPVCLRTAASISESHLLLIYFRELCFSLIIFCDFVILQESIVFLMANSPAWEK